ncbi:MAG: hypothetical protein IKA76_00150 [Clostridia bacterium]|nr:hypothetical protein [Clostridia bacterium]
MVPNGNVVYEQNFDDVTFDPETETYQDLAAKIGWTNLQTSVGKDPTEVDEDEKPIVVPTTYSIVDGMLEILNPYGAGAVKPQIFIPEMERAKDRVVIEYDLMYLNEDILGEYDGGDQPINFTMYGRRSDFYVQWEQTQKGFNKFTFANGKRTDNKTLYGLSNGSLIQIRPQNVGYSDCIGSYKYQDQNQTHYNIYNSLDHVTVVLDKTDGVELYTNGSLTWFLTADQAEMFLATKDLYGNAAGPEHIIGHVLKLSITAGCHARLDNIKVTLDPEEIPELLITEVAATVNDKDTFEYIEVYNNSTEKVNIYEYCLINQTIVNSYKGPKQKVTSLSPAYISLMYPGSHTYKSKPDKKGISAYSLTLENPGYDDGWLEPGEVAMIWNTADAMYNGTYDTPFENMEAWDYTVEDFREAVQIGESTKVFKCYNDQNRTLENGGRYMVGLGKRSVYQPGYSPELQSGDHTIAEIPNTYENIVSYVYMLIDGGFDPYENITVSCQTTKNEEGTSAYPKFGSYCFRNNYSDLLNPKTGGPYTLTTAQFAYGLNNTSPEGLCIDFDNVETRVDATPGEVYDIQKRAFQYKVDDFKTETKYLATKVHYGIYDDTDGMKTLFAIVNGELRTEDFSEVILKDTVVKRAGANLFTANGAALDFDGTNASIRWTTTVKQTDFEALVGYMNEGVITNIEVGTLVAKTADLSDGFALKLENAAEDGKIVKIGAKTADWFLGAAEFVDAEQVKYHKMEASFNIGAEAYDTEYTAVGYISVTMKDGAVYTIYGSKSAEDQSRSVIEIAEAIRADGYQNVDDAKKTWIDSILPAIQ